MQLDSAVPPGPYCSWPVSVAVSDCLILIEADCLWMLSSVHCMMAHAVRMAVSSDAAPDAASLAYLSVQLVTTIMAHLFLRRFHTVLHLAAELRLTR
jgi:hypothetical protein